MKKLLLLLIGLWCSIGIADAQRVSEKLHNIYFDQDYVVMLSKANDTDKFYFYNEVTAAKSNYALVVFDGETNIQILHNSLQILRDKYMEWIEVARKNGVTDFTKAFDIYFPQASLMWYDEYIEDYRFSNYIDIGFTFDVFEGVYLAHFTGEVVDSGNGYAKEDIYWVFSSVDEINAVIDFIDPEKLGSIQDEESVSNLFQ